MHTNSASHTHTFRNPTKQPKNSPLTDIMPQTNFNGAEPSLLMTRWDAPFAGTGDQNHHHHIESWTPHVDVVLRNFFAYMSQGSHLQQALLGLLIGFLGLKFVRATAVTTLLVGLALVLMEWRGHITVNWKTISSNAQESSVQLLKWLEDSGQLGCVSLRWLTEWAFLGGLLLGATFS